MIIYLSFYSTSSRIAEIKKILEEMFEEVVYDEKVYCFYCHRQKTREGTNTIVKKLRFYDEIQSFNFLGT